MNNTVLNAAIALIEDRPEAAREMLRDPSMKGKAQEVLSRFQTSVSKAKDKEVKEVLREILRKTMTLELSDKSIAENNAYTAGVVAVEVIIQSVIEALEL